MAFINPLTISLGTKLATSLGKKYGPKVVSKLKGMTSKKKSCRKFINIGYWSYRSSKIKINA